MEGHPSNPQQDIPTPSDSLSEVERLRQAIAQLTQENADLKIALATTAEHGDVIEAQLYETNQRLQSEIEERKAAQATLQQILEKVSRDKADLQIMLEATAEHGDTVEYQLYTQAVETMRQSEALFRAISESTPILMILTHQLDGVITYANTTSVQRLGLSTQGQTHLTLRSFVADERDAERMTTELERKGKVENLEMQLLDRWGDRFWVSASVHPLQLAGQAILLTTLYDISDRKNAELALQDSQTQLQQQAKELELRVEQRTRELKTAESRYRSIFENAAEGIFQSTPEGQFLSANPSLANILGYESPQDLIDSVTDISQQVYVRSRRRDELLAYLRAFDRLSEFESEVYRKDGSVIWVTETMRAVYDDNNMLLYYEGSVWDVTERKETEAELRQQQMLSERLLLTVLPQVIAQRLKQGETTIADYFSEATVLFADLVNFTELSAKNSPTEIVNLLNSVFSTFDRLADQYRLEKIKTIGDAYMLVGGVPMPMIQHLEATANAAIAMMRAIQQVQFKGEYPLTLRIGIHTGPVVAGVIGKRKFIYDLWGDTVNVASRMEALGEPGQIQVTENVYQRLKRQYRFVKRGAIEVKGKGTMQTYWLVGEKLRLKT